MDKMSPDENPIFPCSYQKKTTQQSKDRLMSLDIVKPLNMNKYF